MIVPGPAAPNPIGTPASSSTVTGLTALLAPPNNLGLNPPRDPPLVVVVVEPVVEMG